MATSSGHPLSGVGTTLVRRYATTIMGIATPTTAVKSIISARLPKALAMPLAIYARSTGETTSAATNESRGNNGLLHRRQRTQ